jgi:hypothetical protein
MQFTVIWLPTAENQLANWWLNRVNYRQSITMASDQIDKLLKTDPFRSVRSRGRFWELTIAPLSVLCDIDVDDRMVKVLQLRWSNG